MEQSESIGQLADALSKAQACIECSVMDASNPFFHSRYSTLASIWQACRESLSKNGLAVIQTTDNENDRVVIITTLAHLSGEWIRGKLAIKPMKDDPQAMGSAITYGRRYALAAMVGVSPEDDDAETAMNRPVKGLVSQQSQKPVASPVVRQGLVEEVIKEGGEFTFKDVGEAMSYLVSKTKMSTSELYKLGQVKSGAEVKDPNAFAKFVLQNIKDGVK